MPLGKNDTNFKYKILKDNRKKLRWVKRRINAIGEMLVKDITII